MFTMVVGGLVIVVVGFYFVSMYNGLIQLKNNIKKSRSNIMVLMKQRYSELPKLVQVVKRYVKYEKKLLKDITEARSIYNKANTLKQKAAANNMLSGALKTLFAVSENYPKLQASAAFLKLQDRISTLESHIADRREFYNDSVNLYNIKIQSIPDSVFANMLKYREEELFKASKKEMADVKLNL
jgi:LemA protein